MKSIDEARTTAGARGFDNPSDWAQQNRRAAKQLKDKSLVNALDREYEQFGLARFKTIKQHGRK